ncbi:MAG TPA: hypothetical protein PKM73_18850 [Verrucomicrobiota bacterium]|nr:hypothetical protein [Verrucomicrobiota bacterium]HNU52950.1 hypothetical protein [Verrucomicrobiota bacterium]
MKRDTQTEFDLGQIRGSAPEIVEVAGPDLHAVLDRLEGEGLSVWRMDVVRCGSWRLHLRREPKSTMPSIQAPKQNAS